MTVLELRDRLNDLMKVLPSLAEARVVSPNGSYIADTFCTEILNCGWCDLKRFDHPVAGVKAWIHEDHKKAIGDRECVVVVG